MPQPFRPVLSNISAGKWPTRAAIAHIGRLGSQLNGKRCGIAVVLLSVFSEVICNEEAEKDQISDVLSLLRRTYAMARYAVWLLS